MFWSLGYDKHLLHEMLTETTMAQPIVSSYPLPFSMLHSGGINCNTMISQIRYSLVVILELNGISEVQYKEVMIIDDK